MGLTFCEGVVTNDIFTKEDGEFLIRNAALSEDRILAVETGKYISEIHSTIDHLVQPTPPPHRNAQAVVHMLPFAKISQ